jgi:hypothetical protein
LRGIVHHQEDSSPNKDRKDKIADAQMKKTSKVEHQHRRAKAGKSLLDKVHKVKKALPVETAKLEYSIVNKTVSHSKTSKTINRLRMMIRMEGSILLSLNQFSKKEMNLILDHKTLLQKAMLTVTICNTIEKALMLKCPRAKALKTTIRYLTMTERKLCILIYI